MGTTLRVTGWPGMPSKSEIEFCERWLDLRGPDGEVWGGEYLHPSVAGSPVVAVLLSREGRPTLWDLTPRGADLVASYETAVSMGLEIVPDPGPGMRPPWDPAPVRLIQVGVACDCDDGFVGVPVQYSKAGGIVQVWPAKCPKCNVDRGRPGVDLVWEAALLAGTGAALGVIDDGWQPLTHELAATLEGKRIEARSSGDPHPCTVIGLSPCAKWLRVDFIDGRYERAGALGLRGGWYVRVIDEAWVTEPAAMMALLEEARLEGFEVEVKATERPGGKSSHRKLGSGGPVSLVHAFSAVQAYVNFTWCAVAGYRGEYVGASPILTAVRRVNGGRHGDA